MRKPKLGTIIAVLIIIVVLLILFLRQQPLEQGHVQMMGQTNNFPLAAAEKKKTLERMTATNSPPLIYLTQAEQDDRQHIWGKKNLPEVDKACLHGAEAKVTLRVIDSRGEPVPEAEVNVTFSPREPNEAGKNIMGLTDKEGLFTAMGKTTYDIFYSASKTNHYLTVRKYPFYWRGTECAKDGRWIPWNPTLEVVLKEKLNPIPMYQNYIETVMPAGTNRLGFDFLIGDWVAPNGKGTIADMWYVYDENFIDRDNFFIKLSFVFPGEHNGCYMRKTDNYSELLSEHEALDTEITPSKICVIEQEKGKYTKELRFAEDDYMVIRIRTIKDEQGKIVSSHYGKIYGPVDVPHRWSKKFSFTYYLNPTPNDRNLEYDPQKNLTPTTQQHTMNRNLP